MAKRARLLTALALALVALAIAGVSDHLVTALEDLVMGALRARLTPSVGA